MITVQTDGATNEKLRKSGAGIFIKTEEAHFEYSLPLEYMSNHQAEFHAVIEALKICNKDFPNHILAFQTDSQIVASSIENNFVKNEQFKPLLKTIRHLSKQHPHFFIKWVASQHNKKADDLAKKAIYQ